MQWNGWIIRRFVRQFLGWGVGAIATLLVLCTGMLDGLPTLKSVQAYPVPTIAQISPQQAEQQANALFEGGRFSEAAAELQHLVQIYAATGDRLAQAAALGNLALTYQKLNQWQNAEQAIASSLELLNSPTGGMVDAQRRSVLAQVLDAQGAVQLAIGQTQQALNTWQRSAELYEQLRDTAGMVRSRVNQSQAMQALGLNRRAIATLTAIEPLLNDQPDSVVKAASLRNLGDALQIAGRLAQSRQVLLESLNIAQRLGNQDAIAAAHLSLGNWAVASRDLNRAIDYYRQVAQAETNPRAQAQLNLLKIWILQQNWAAAEQERSQLNSALERLPAGRETVYAYINYGESLLQLAAVQPEGDRAMSLRREAAQWLAAAKQQATALQDVQSLSYAVGMLGKTYAETDQWSIAQNLTQEALQLANSIRRDELIYRWQWQQGRILKEQNRVEEAIASYERSLETLKTLRRDLVTTNPSYQLTFREETEEPLYRELISLLLRDAKPDQEKLKKARSVATSLQVAELENFLRQPCSVVNPEQIDDTVDRLAKTTAVLYPIVLPDRLEVIVKLPDRSALLHFRQTIAEADLQTVVRELQLDLEREYTFSAIKQNANQLYQWLIQPVRDELENSRADTLIFALDSVLRSIPMSVLYDGKHYLVETYATAITLGLDLPSPTPFQPDTLNILAVGLTDPPKNFSINGQDLSANFAQLTNVNSELDAIAASGVPITAIRDQKFTETAFNDRLNRAAFPIVHMATHGQFSSDPQSTFLLTADGAIAVDDLSEMFQARGAIRPDAIELLLLNACETAAGDRLAALGIAGTAFRAGARSVIASLWTLDDTSGVEMARQFYAKLLQPEMTKAKLLQQSQLALLQNPQFEHPRYWATYTLLGNWL